MLTSTTCMTGLSFSLDEALDDVSMSLSVSLYIYKRKGYGLISMNTARSSVTILNLPPSMTLAIDTAARDSEERKRALGYRSLSSLFFDEPAL